MSGFLFEQIIFGPIRSRRLGISLGVNLLPIDHKHCTFNCLYCECGWTQPGLADSLSVPSRDDIRDALKKKLTVMAEKKEMLTTITFAGNGEPTLHPDFAAIIGDTVALRNKLYPTARIAVLSNASLAGDEVIARALMQTDMNILKLDAGTEETFRIINNPAIRLSLAEVVENLLRFKGQMIIQTLFVKGHINGIPFDNTTDHEVEAWLNHLKKLKPGAVMIYPIARATPAEDVQVIPHEKLLEIASRVEQAGISAEVY